VFLTGASVNEHGKPKDKLQNQLRLCFKDFSKKCSDALEINEQIIEPERASYQVILSFIENRIKYKAFVFSANCPKITWISQSN
jgi:hypothetical protein